MDQSKFNNTQFRSWNQRINKEDELRTKLQTKWWYGIEFLDRATLGISQNDLIVFAAKSGLGKTQILSNIAMTNVRLGAKVGYFALEAEENEIERRILYRTILEYKMKDPFKSKVPANYGLWRRGLMPELDKYEFMARESLNHLDGGLFTFYRTGKFGVKDLAKELGKNPGFDMIIIDHLQYFDIESSNENKETKEIVKAIRDSNLDYQMPILLATHVRKGMDKNKSIIPGIEDIHGSSDIYKIATQVVIWGKGKTQSSDESLTFFNVAKRRDDSSVTMYAGATLYSYETMSYADKFGLYYNSDSANLEEVPADKSPFWSRVNAEGDKWKPGYQK